jgi:DNA-binding MarR family transcriptional regulator
MATVRDPKSSPSRGAGASGKDIAALAARLRERLRMLIRVRSVRDPMSHIAPDLTGPQVHAIVALGIDRDTPLTMSTLAQRIGVGLPAATGVVDRLERDGFVERLRDESDRRVVRVALTERGRDTYRQADEHMNATLCQFLTALPPGERATFVDVVCRALGVVCDLASQPPKDAP